MRLKTHGYHDEGWDFFIENTVNVLFAQVFHAISIHRLANVGNICQINANKS